MKKYIFLIILVFTSISFYGQENNRINLMGKLQKLHKLPKDIPNCGYFMFARIMEFEVWEGASNSSDLEVRTVIVPCTLDYGKDFFKIDEIYAMTLELGNVNSYRYILVGDPKSSNIINRDSELWLIDIKHK